MCCQAREGCVFCLSRSFTVSWDWPKAASPALYHTYLVFWLFDQCACMANLLAPPVTLCRLCLCQMSEIPRGISGTLSLLFVTDNKVTVAPGKEGITCEVCQRESFSSSHPVTRKWSCECERHAANFALAWWGGQCSVHRWLWAVQSHVFHCVKWLACVWPEWRVWFVLLLWQL